MIDSVASRAETREDFTIACDVGGTFTDLIVRDEQGLQLFKAPSTPEYYVGGVISALELAAAAYNAASINALLSRCGVFIHATTQATNALLIGNVAKTAFLTTEGHRDILLLREGGRLNPYDNTQDFPKPYIPRALTFEVCERIDASGQIVRALDESKLSQTIDELAARRVEAIGVCLLWSIVNPKHELRIGELISRRLPEVPVTLSHRLNPIVREYRRASSTCIDASLRPSTGQHIADLGDQLAKLGLKGRLLVVTSKGGLLDARAAAEAPIHLVRSGPSLAPIAGRHVARIVAPRMNAIVTDTGADATPSPTTTSVLAPAGVPSGTLKFVDDPKLGWIETEKSLVGA